MRCEILTDYLYKCLCVCVHADYFANHMGDYEGVLASLETLNLSILKAMDFTKKVCVCVCVLLSV